MQFDYCSANCLHKKYSNLEQVAHGQTAETKNAYLIDGGKQVLLSLKASNRTNTHPLGAQHTTQKLELLWKTIAQNPHENLMTINEVCECSASVVAVQGIPLYNAKTTPGWLAVRVGWDDYLQQKKKLGTQEWCALMADLSAGLEHLHQLGIAHGDPYPFNAMVTNEGKALWVDFGNITDDPTYFRKDVLAFAIYTLIFTVKYCEAISPSLLQELAEAIATENTCDALKKCQAVLKKERQDWKYQFSDDDILKNFYEPFLQNDTVKKNVQKWAFDHMMVMGNEDYYEAFFYWMRKADEVSQNLEIEREKFYLYSAEVDRLTVPNYVHNQVLAEKDSLSNQLIVQEKEKQELVEKHKEVCEWADSLTEQLNQAKTSLEKHKEVCEWADYLTEQLNQAKAANVRNNLSVLMYTNRIGEILEWGGFRRWILLYAFLKKLKNVSLGQKIAMLGKGVASLFGHKRSLGLGDYNPACLIWSNLNAIQSVVQAKDENDAEGTPKANSYVPAAAAQNVSAVQVEKTVEQVEYILLPKVTVLLPVYNHAEFIHLAVDSILNQTYSNLELIMLDDGSTDGLKEKVKKYQLDYRFKFYQQPNQKLPMGLTHLHELATGDYVTWTSADNIMEPDMIETLVKEMQRRPDAEMIFGDVRLIDENGEPLLQQEYRDFNRDLIVPDILRLPRNTEPLGAECDNYINACFMYRRSASQALENRYACDLVGLEDYDYWLRMQRCGKIIHAQTLTPLYRYRVHKNTMSEELLTAKREQHVKRAQSMFEMETAREKWAEKRWHLNFQCDKKLEEKLRDAANKLPTELANGAEKNLWFFDRQPSPNGNAKKDAYCVVKNEEYHLGRFVSGEWKELVTVKLGNNVNPLALKARYTHMPSPYYEYNNPKHLPVIGCHEYISKIDQESVLNTIQKNPMFYFVFADADKEQKDNKEFVEMIQRQSNAVYLGYREFGVPYQMYSSWDAVLLPKMKDVVENQIVRGYHLALTLGKWCVYDESYDFLNGSLYAIPYGIHYDFSDVDVVIRQPVNFERMDLCLSTMNCEARLNKVLHYANAMMQDYNVERPDFGIKIPEETKPVFVKPDLPAFMEKLKKKNGYIALAVDHLHQGGMEQVVAMLACKLREYGLPVEVLCTIDGGTVAEQLRADGIKVTEFQGDPKRMKQYLKENPPMIISSHYLHSCTKVPHELGIPMVETIHNMLAFFDDDAWSKEKGRSQDFDAYIAVSDMVRQYYCAFNDAVDPHKITVVGNAADPKRVSGVEKGLFRASLGLKPDDFIYMFVASFDGRKNHIGLITAFNEMKKRVEAPVKLILMGNVLDENFYNKCQEYITACKCQNDVKILPYRHEVATVLADADVAVIPSYIEGWSISATEAQYAGKPLIHTNCGSGPELCGNNEFGILIENPAGDPLKMDQTTMYSCMMKADPSNTNQLADAMYEMYEERAEWKKKSPQIRTRAINLFNYDRMVQGYLEVFSNILISKE